MTGRTFDSVLDIRLANEALGHYWFSPGARRFFRSRVGSKVYGGRYFVSSEQFDDDTPRRYSVRVVNDDGSIDTVGEFQAYPTWRAAARAAQELAAVTS